MERRSRRRAPKYFGVGAGGWETSVRRRDLGVVSATRPTAYPLVPVTDCKDGSNVTIGCLVTDFFPEPVTVTWVSGVTGDQLTFPAVQNGGSYYTVSSQLTVPASSYDGQNFQCKVTHAPTSTSLSEDITGETKKTPGLSSRGGATPQSSTFGRSEVPKLAPKCSIWGKHPQNLSFWWNQEYGASVWLQNAPKISIFEDGASVWLQNAPKISIFGGIEKTGRAFGCGFWRPHPPYPAQRRSPPHPTPGPGPKLEVTLLPPSLEDLYISQNASVTCVATNAPQDLKFSWSRSEGTALDVVTGEPQKQENGLYRLTSVLKICAEEWNSGESFTCGVAGPEIQGSVTKSVQKDLGRKPRPKMGEEKFFWGKSGGVWGTSGEKFGE
uniref:Ig-like domain-containing protein n=1 Tax=Anas zonorhyncha TaxID=75864 RepID=A0A8B9VFB9_9AVES